MIIFRPSGRLGNQMFQYAYAATQALKNGCPLRVDKSWYVGRSEEFLLEKIFSLNISEATAEEKKRILGLSSGDFFLRLYGKERFRKYRPKNIIVEKEFAYDPELSFISAPKYILTGYWQSELYFSDYSDHFSRIFRKGLVVNRNNIDKILKLKEATGRVAVSVHIRLGDYLTNAAARELHYVNLSSYLRRSVEQLSIELINPWFFVFSDCPEDIPAAVRNLIQGRGEIMPRELDEGPFDDLCAMSKCDHNIIANSTYSWWGGWLNTKKDKIVIAPDVWFNDAIIPTKGLIPESWRRVSVNGT